jgi:hypothetical protein
VAADAKVKVCVELYVLFFTRFFHLRIDTADGGGKTFSTVDILFCCISDCILHSCMVLILR